MDTNPVPVLREIKVSSSVISCATANVFEIMLGQITLINKRHRRTLETIFAQPISGNIKWRDVESLLETLGADLTQRRGSRVSVSLNDRIVVFHRPHPSPNMDKGAVRDLRRFLQRIGITP